ncbi:MAG: hypothetical protein IJZ30_04745 [Alphaproteobacteria bacterium]|nr:hypothetical protein [Alphaproteobacteria bacterium]
MKSVICMMGVFLGVCIILYYDIFSFFAQSWALTASIVLSAIMVLIALFIYPNQQKKKNGGNNEI